MYAEFLAAIEATQEIQEDLAPTGDAQAVLLVDVANLLARCEVIVRALAADEKA